MRHFFVIVALGEIFYGIVLGQRTFYEGQNPNGGHFPPNSPNEDERLYRYEDGKQLNYFQEDDNHLKVNEEKVIKYPPEEYPDENQQKLFHKNNPYQIAIGFQEKNRAPRKKRSDDSNSQPSSGWDWGGWGGWISPKTSSTTTTTTTKPVIQQDSGWGGWGNWRAPKTPSTTSTTTKQPIMIQEPATTPRPRARKRPKGRRRRKGTRRPPTLGPQNAVTEPSNSPSHNAPPPNVPNEYPGYKFPRNFFGDMLSGLNSKLPVIQTSTPEPPVAAVPPGIPNDYPKYPYPKNFFGDMLSGLNSTLPPIKSPEDSYKASTPVPTVVPPGIPNDYPKYPYPKNFFGDMLSGLKNPLPPLESPGDSSKAPLIPLNPEADSPGPPGGRIKPTRRGRHRKRRPGSGRPRRRRPKFLPQLDSNGMPISSTDEPNKEFVTSVPNPSPEIKTDGIDTTPVIDTVTEIIEEDSSEYDTTSFPDTDQTISYQEDYDNSSFYPNKNYSIVAGPATFSRPREMYETLLTPDLNRTKTKHLKKHHPRKNELNRRRRIKHHRRPFGSKKNNGNDTITNTTQVWRQEIEDQNEYPYGRYIEYELRSRNLSEPDSYIVDEPDEDYSQIIGSAREPDDSEYNSNPNPDELLKASNDFTNDSYSDDNMKQPTGFNSTLLLDDFLSYIRSAFGSSATTPSPHTLSPEFSKTSNGNYSHEDKEQSTGSNTTYPANSLGDFLSYMRNAFRSSLTTPSPPSPDEEVVQSTGSNTTYTPLGRWLSYLRSAFGSPLTPSTSPASTNEENEGSYDEAEDRIDETSNEFETTMMPSSQTQIIEEMTSDRTTSQELSTEASVTPTEYLTIDSATETLVETTVDVLSPAVKSDDNSTMSTRNLLDFFKNFFSGLRNSSDNSSMPGFNKTIEKIMEEGGSKNGSQLRPRKKFPKWRKMRRRKKGRLQNLPNISSIPTESTNTSYSEPELSDFDRYLSNILSNLWPKDSSSSITELISTEEPFASTLQQTTSTTTQSSITETQKPLSTAAILQTPSTAASIYTEIPLTLTVMPTSSTIKPSTSTMVFSTPTETTATPLKIASSTTQAPSTSTEEIYTSTEKSSTPMAPSTYITYASIETSSAESSKSSSVIPLTSTEITLTTIDISSTTTEMPSTSTELPLTSTELPSTSTELPSTSTEIPSTSSEIPSTSTEIPSTSTEIPSTSTEMPLTSTEIPLTTTEIPSTSTEIPSTSTEMPLTSTEMPLTSSEIPLTSTEMPLTSTEMPLTSTERPLTPTEKTSPSTEIPSTPTEKTSTSTEIPSTSAEVPLTSTEIPFTPTERPLTSAEIPSTTTETPPSSTKILSTTPEIMFLTEILTTEIQAQTPLTYTPASSESLATSIEAFSTSSSTDLSSTQPDLSSTVKITATTEMLSSSTESLTMTSNIPSKSPDVTLASTENLPSSTETFVTTILPTSIEVTSPTSAVSEEFSTSSTPSSVSESVTVNDITTASEDIISEMSTGLINNAHDEVTTEVTSNKEDNDSQKSTTALLLYTKGETTEKPEISSKSISDILDEEEAESVPVTAIPPPGVECKENETYYSCVPHCQHTCFNFDSDVPCLPNFCEPGCFCSPGLVIDENGKCVEVKDCYQQACGIDEEWWECKPECHNTCVNYARAEACQDTECDSGCFCREGLIRDVDGSCVDPEECADPVCLDHEEETDCMSPCNTCTANCHSCKFLMCRSGCDCRDGYKRNDKGECILAAKCPKCDVPNPDHTNSTEVN